MILDKYKEQPNEAVKKKISKKKLEEKIILSNKYEIAGINHFSISSMNQFRANSMAWALRYFLGFRSLYPKPSMVRGIAIEKATENARLNVREGFDPEHPSFLEENSEKIFQARIVDQTLSMFGDDLPLDRDYCVVDFAEKDAETFISEYPVLLQNLFEMISPPEWLKEEQIPKLASKVIKELSIVKECAPHAIEYILSLEGEIRSQVKIEKSELFGLPVGFLAYADWIKKDSFGVDMKTVSYYSKIPKTWEEVPTSYKCQVAAYSEFSGGLDWKLVFVAPVSKKLINDIQKEKILFDLYKEIGNEPKAIMQAYKTRSIDGKGTTVNYVNEKIKEFESPSFELKQIPAPLKVIDIPKEEVQKYQRFNKATAYAINNIISSCDPKSFGDDLLTLCIADPDNMMLDPHERFKIKEVWGIESSKEEVDTE
jgi:hypothetical protein